MTPNKTSIVLLSSGLDSTVNLYKAHRETSVLMTLTFNYGQKAAEKELERAKKISEGLGIPNKVVELPFLQSITKTSLVNTEMDVPTGEQVSIHDLKTSEETAKAVWVPNRNGVFLNIAAAYADALRADYIIPGFNREEATTFPDNSKEYMDVSTEALKYSTGNQAQVMCYTIDMDKKEIHTLGEELKVPFDLIWSCYFAGESPCGQCESCQRSLSSRFVEPATKGLHP
jgi:7-cyano-7-deazaguanine synthase